jgi:uncharacterized protein YndB with AHSA1/START domain
MAVDSTRSAETSALEPVRKSVRVRATPEKAFRVFAQEMGSWWPRTHHIGKSPMVDVQVDGRPGGAITTLQEDGTYCPWGTVLRWEPPHRFVLAWQVSPDWQFEPDLERCSEVEVLFTPADDGTTLVELEHRGIERHGANAASMRDAVGSDGGWNTVLAQFVAKVGPA